MNKDLTAEEAKKELLDKIFIEIRDCSWNSRDTCEAVAKTCVEYAEQYAASQRVMSPQPPKWVLDEIARYIKAMDAIYNHNEAARAAVIEHFGLHHNNKLIEWAASQRVTTPLDASETQDGSYYDLSDMPEDQKREFLNNLTTITSRELMRAFLSLGLKTHIEQMVIEENSGKEFVLSFRTLTEHIKFNREWLSSSPERKDQTDSSNTEEPFSRCKLTDSELIEKCRQWVIDLCESGGKKWTLSIPVDFNRDPDILIHELADRYNRLLNRTPKDAVCDASKDDSSNTSDPIERKDHNKLNDIA